MPLLEKERHDLERREVDRFHIDRVDAIEHLFAYLPERLATLRHAGVVDHDVELAELSHGGSNHVLCVGAARDISSERVCSTASVGYGFGHRSRLGDIEQYD